MPHQHITSHLMTRIEYFHGSTLHSQNDKSLVRRFLGEVRSCLRTDTVLEYSPSRPSGHDNSGAPNLHNSDIQDQDD